MMRYARKINSILIYRSYAPTFLRLNDEEAGKLIKAILLDFSGEKPDLNMTDSLRVVYDLLSGQIDAGAQRYIKKHNLAVEGNGSARSSEADQAAPVDAAPAQVVDPVEAIGPAADQADSPAPAADQAEEPLQPVALCGQRDGQEEA